MSIQASTSYLFNRSLVSINTQRVSQNLNDNYLFELIKCCLRSKETFTVVYPHLKFEFFPTKGFKKLWKSICAFEGSHGRMPSLGILSEMFKTNVEVLEIIAEIKQTALPNQRVLLEQFVVFIKNSKFLDLHQLLAEKWNEGKQEDAFHLLEKRAENIVNFSLGSENFTRVFEQFQQRHDARFENELTGDIHVNVRKFLPFYVPGLDSIIDPGIALKDTVLITAQSGVGKTKALRYIATQNAKNGCKVAHFQAEGSKEECVAGYDATWMMCGYMDIIRNKVAQTLPPKIQRRLADIIHTNRGEVFVEAFEEFGRAKLADVRSWLRNLISKQGHIDLVVLDYFELFDPIGNHFWKPGEERHRRELLSQQIKNIATEFNTRVITATQGSTVSPDLLNDPNFVMTRFNISEMKGVVRPFSFHLTLNRTRDEVGMSMARLFMDKFRNYKSNQVIHFYQNYDKEQFCDYKRSLIQGKIFYPGEKSASYIYYELDDDRQKLHEKQFTQFINQ